ncbi:IS91 family transposase [Rhizobium pusense]|uniref:IS91 family transposase n=1 Tax=Agrobacterium pusense TaxID=648995 RepID=UPI000D1BCCFC|nr:IS91 family transposase [Agrobacterium pusense]MDH0912848.1 IS91 family transposase [Agrobacterium pusense]MDH1099087.1 IS91 family transposase [Agrobacterium pusense]MDH1115656.1 IS91 family transposase [Agrobacterium pusense]MDH2197431.1 IS91 family transposase [Agrobacterium pusense]
MVAGLEVADIFRRHGERYRQTHDAHLGRVERRVMSAVELCRTARLGGHVQQCQDCEAIRIAYNSCRNRHCPKCQGQASRDWLAARQADLLPVGYFHVVFTVPQEIAAISFQNKAALYAIQFQAAARTLRRLAADPRHLGAEIGFIAVLHSWGQNLHYHPHIHCIVPGGGLSADQSRWVACRAKFFMPVRVLSRLFRRVFLEELKHAYDLGQLQFCGDIAGLADPAAFNRIVKEARRVDWVVYAKPPFAGPEQVLAYLGRYTHRIAISHSRLIGMEGDRVTFRWKDYRHGGRQKVMMLDAHEFIRRFLLHAVPDGFHRIRHYGLLANGHRQLKLDLCRRLLDVPPPEQPIDDPDAMPPPLIHRCPCCGGAMAIIGAWTPIQPPCRPAWDDSS